MHIYKITNLTNGKLYIGQTAQRNPKMRWYGHLADMRSGKKLHLYNSMRKYGIEMFTWEVIDSASDLNELNHKEQYWLNQYRTTHAVYNLREAGDNKTHSAESIEKMRNSQRAAHARRRNNGGDGGWARRDGGPMLGKPHPKKGKPSTKWSDEDKQRHSETCLNRKQREITPELKEKLANSKGKTWKLVDGKRVWIEKE
jgi:group I intron endonuclease